MNGKEKRIRILDIQEQHCQKCAHKMKLLQDCSQHCEVGKELFVLGEELFGGQKKQFEYSQEKWDVICRKAVTLFERGVGATMVAKTLCCHTSSLRDQLKKRGLWKGYTQTERQDRSRKKWNDLCQQALKLRAQGLSYRKIAIRLGVPASTLSEHMRKRGFS